jgi:hypothetical protein
MAREPIVALVSFPRQLFHRRGENDQSLERAIHVPIM